MSHTDILRRNQAGVLIDPTELPAFLEMPSLAFHMQTKLPCIVSLYSISLLVAARIDGADAVSRNNSEYAMTPQIQEYARRQ